MMFGLRPCALAFAQKPTANKTINVKGKHTEKVKGDRSITVEQGNMDRTVSAGKVVDKVAQSHEVTVGTQYKLQATNISESAKAKHEVSAAMVDTSAKLGCFVELIELNDTGWLLLEQMRAAHLGWDGREPLRPYPAF